MTHQRVSFRKPPISANFGEERVLVVNLSTDGAILRQTSDQNSETISDFDTLACHSFFRIVPDHTRAVAPSPLFAGISQLVSVTFNVRGGEEIFGEGEDAQFVYKLVTGSVRVCKMLTDGQRHISCFHLPGDVFGLERTITHRMGADATQDSQVLMFRRSQVERLIASDLNAAHQMLGIFISKLDDAETHMFRLGRQNALQRVAAFLVEIEERLGQRGSLELPMTRRDIGDYLGLSIETVSRSISQLQRQRALAWVERGRMHLDQTKIDGMVEH